MINAFSNMFLFGKSIHVLHCFLSSVLQAGVRTHQTRTEYAILLKFMLNKLMVVWDVKCINKWIHSYFPSWFHESFSSFLCVPFTSYDLVSSILCCSAYSPMLFFFLYNIKCANEVRMLLSSSFAQLNLSSLGLVIIFGNFQCFGSFLFSSLLSLMVSGICQCNYCSLPCSTPLYSFLLFWQEDYEQRMERRRLVNREAARRSRIRRQVIYRDFIISFVN